MLRSTFSVPLYFRLREPVRFFVQQMALTRWLILELPSHRKASTVKGTARPARLQTRSARRAVARASRPCLG